MKTLALLLTMLLAACDLRQLPDVSKHDLFEMKQQCSESVPRVLKYGIDYGENTMAIQTHNNAKLNMCFVVLQWEVRNPNLPLTHNWTLVDAQSYTHIHVEPGDKVWMALMESNDLDAVVAAITQGGDRWRATGLRATMIIARSRAARETRGNHAPDIYPRHRGHCARVCQRSRPHGALQRGPSTVQSGCLANPERHATRTIQTGLSRVWIHRGHAGLRQMRPVRGSACSGAVRGYGARHAGSTAEHDAAVSDLHRVPPQHRHLSVTAPVCRAPITGVLG